MKTPERTDKYRRQIGDQRLQIPTQRPTNIGAKQITENKLLQTYFTLNTRQLIGQSLLALLNLKPYTGGPRYAALYMGQTRQEVKRPKKAFFLFLAITQSPDMI